MQFLPNLNVKSFHENPFLTIKQQFPKNFNNTVPKNPNQAKFQIKYSFSSPI